MIKTNAMRKLDSLKIKYATHSYSDTDAISGIEVAAVLNEDPARVFKTLVTTGKSGTHYVFVIPVEKELDLKKAARETKEKSIEMLKMKELLALTGYVHGGCSPIGMKKAFKTFVHDTADKFDTIYISGGKIGCQIEAAPSDIKNAIQFEYADLIK